MFLEVRRLISQFLRTSVAPNFWTFIRKKSKSSIELFIIEPEINVLSELAVNYGTDKGFLFSDPKLAHSYTDFYHFLLKFKRFDAWNILEFGIGSTNTKYENNMGVEGKPGASLRMWRDYFPNANIYGADVDSSILFEENRIKTFYLDALRIDTFNRVIEHLPSQLDLIIDDSLHTFKAGKNLFENFFHLLSKSGYYIIEDVSLGLAKEYIEYLKTKKVCFNFVRLQTSHLSVLGNNNLIVITNQNN
jgi:hypothetical protein